MKRALPSGEVAMASKLFEQFFAAEVFEDVMGSFQNLCSVLQITPGHISNFYPVIKANVRSLCATNLFQILDKRISLDVYSQQFACDGTKVVIVGGGPCGLRTAIECQLLGANAIVMEKRTDFARNNVLHLWPFVIEDLKLLGVKVFFPKFCTGSMDHISIRRLQTILLKVSLVLGARVFAPVEFVDLVEPTDHDEVGWRVKVNPPNHPLNKINIDVLVGAEGKRVTVPGFKRKEFRGKLAIAITANFVNNRTTAEAVVEEISGVAFVYKQDFFNSLYDELGIALENIVYYKDETHYFVMTTKKHSLLDRKVLKKDCQDPIELLSSKNINQKQLLEYIRDACDFCTDYQLPDLQFALNHHGEPDVAIFDFTSMFASANSAYVQEKHGKQLLCALVGDGLLEPFWPTGSGCARGFLGVLDCCHMMAEWCQGSKSVLQILAERESIFRLLPQTTSENIAKDLKNYTIDPTTRYPNMNKYLYGTHQVEHLYITDDDSNKNEARRNYIPGFESRTSRRQTASASASRHAAKPARGRFDDLEFEEDDTPAFDFQELRRKMIAATRQDTDTNNAEEYINNRAKMVRNEAEKSQARPSNSSGGSSGGGGGRSSTSRPGRADTEEKFDRQAAIQKISDTFGYGEGKRPTASQRQPEAANVSRPGPSERRQAAAEMAAANKYKQQQLQQQQEAKKAAAAAAKKKSQGVPKYEFKPAQQSRRSDLDRVIDPELDVMLAELETDEDFQKMSDNEQVAWLESLFFLDVGSRQARGGLVAPKPRKAPSPPRGNKSSLYSNNNNSSSNDNDNNNNHGVSAKSLRIQSNSKAAPSAAPAEPKSADLPSGLNPDLCSIAQQFFANEGKKKPTVTKKPVASVKPQSHIQPASTSRFADNKNVAIVDPVVRVPERASFHTFDEKLLPEPEDDKFPKFSGGRQAKAGSSDTDPETSGSGQSNTPPPIPERSSQPKALMMMKLMKNATNALRS